jgi:hypothetical protein
MERTRQCERAIFCVFSALELLCKCSANHPHNVQMPPCTMVHSYVATRTVERSVFCRRNDHRGCK